VKASSDPAEILNQGDVPPHLKREKIISLLKKKFDFENAHLKAPSNQGSGILSKCLNYETPNQAKDLGIYPFFREIEATNGSKVQIANKDVITVSTNNYLGLTKDP